jgi:aminoglycoside 3-N-acetyltransferase I
MAVEIRQLNADELVLMRGMLAMFGQAFEDPPTYMARQPRADYLKQLLAGDYFIALAALDGDQVVGGIAAYELRKFEQERSEIYIYDLAVLSSHRRQGVATAMIEALKKIAVQRGAYAIFVQADTDEDDLPAIALYEKLGIRAEVLHFDISPAAGTEPGA